MLFFYPSPVIMVRRCFPGTQIRTPNQQQQRSTRKAETSLVIKPEALPPSDAKLNVTVLKWRNSFLPQEWGSVWLRLVSTSWQSNSSQMPSVTTQRSLSESGVFVEPCLEASSELPERVASPVWFQVVWQPFPVLRKAAAV